MRMAATLGIVGALCLLTSSTMGAEPRSKDRKGRGDRAQPAVSRIIARFDRDGDKRLSRRESPDWLRQQFPRMDTNGDGILDGQELAVGQGMQPRRATMEPNAMFRRLDKNSDGKISKDEAQGRISENFLRMDLDGDGSISAAEFSRIMQRLRDRQQPTLKATFFDQDADSDGRVTKREASGELAERFRELDANNDGQLDIREVTTKREDKDEKRR